MSKEIYVTQNELRALRSMRPAGAQLTIALYDGAPGESESVEVMDYSGNEWVRDMIDAYRESKNKLIKMVGE